MSELNEATPSARRNPLIWIVLVVVGLILFVFLSGERGAVSTSLKTQQTAVAMSEDETVAELESAVGSIERGLLVPPGMRAR